MEDHGEDEKHIEDVGMAQKLDNPQVQVTKNEETEKKVRHNA